MNKHYFYLLNKYAEAVFPESLWEAHFGDNVPISDDFYGASGKMNDELADNMNRYENKSRDGSEPSVEKDKEQDEESQDDKDEDEIESIEKRRKKHKKNKQQALEVHPFYQSLYGYTGFEGAYTSPLEYYSGSIADEPGAQTINPYMNTYQYASDNSIKIKIRAMILKDFRKKHR